MAVASLGLEAVTRFDRVDVKPLRERATDVPQLLERAFLAKRASLRFTDLTPRNQEALRRYQWPGNLAELREAATKLACLAEHGSIRKAAGKLPLPRTTLQYWVDSMELEVPVATPR